MVTFMVKLPLYVFVEIGYCSISCAKCFRHKMGSHKKETLSDFIRTMRIAQCQRNIHVGRVV